ncbi:MAG: hypothetical protein OXC66_07790 [Roseovarius sp.]|nr:hypothetical protein [Roseovarius sp.]
MSIHIHTSEALPCRRMKFLRLYDFGREARPFQFTAFALNPGKNRHHLVLSKTKQHCAFLKISNFPLSMSGNAKQFHS